MTSYINLPKKEVLVPLASTRRRKNRNDECAILVFIFSLHPFELKILFFLPAMRDWRIHHRQNQSVRLLCVHSFNETMSASQRARRRYTVISFTRYVDHQFPNLHTFMYAPGFIKTHREIDIITLIFQHRQNFFLQL
ncbi:hypothetical protein BDA99DRAFT_577022 [Phascolomyces articulosus]|uniref:Uncharacterized protein n=1 Tax=Phascolomyces articulosus TaxID=60185 RepID=A0AAD5P7B7_9FUNG|nr:hypothetical protein BDA99DRAFT_577022 [Phascolomyces articulosus]